MNLDENIPSENDKLTSLAIILEETVEQSLNNEIGMKSTEDQ